MSSRAFQGGGLPGFRSRMTRYLAPRISVIVLANADYAAVDRTADKIARQWLSDNLTTESRAEQ